MRSMTSAKAHVMGIRTSEPSAAQTIYDSRNSDALDGGLLIGIHFYIMYGLQLFRQ